MDSTIAMARTNILLCRCRFISFFRACLFLWVAMSSEVRLNFGRLIVRDNVYDLYWQVPGYGVSVAGVTLPVLYEAVATLVDAYVGYLGLAKQMDEYISYVDNGWCIAECRSGAWIVQQTCEKAREACELWQNGFSRFVTRDELVERKARYEETAQKTLLDINTIQGAAPPPKLQVYSLPSRSKPPVWVLFKAIGRFNRARARLLKKTPTAWVEQQSQEALIPHNFQLYISEPGEYKMRVEHLTTGEVAEATFIAESPAPPAPPQAPPPPTWPPPPQIPPHTQLAIYIVSSFAPAVLSIATAVVSEFKKPR